MKFALTITAASLILLSLSTCAFAACPTVPKPASNIYCAGNYTAIISLGGASPTNVSVQGFADKIIFAAQGMDSKVYVKEIGTMNKSTLADWYNVNLGATLAAPKLVVKSYSLYIYVKGTDGFVYFAKYLGTGSWSAWNNTLISNTCFGSSGPFSTKGSDGQVYRAIGNPLDLQVCSGGGHMGTAYSAYLGLVGFSTNDSQVITFLPPVVGSGGAGYNLTSYSTNQFVISNNDSIGHQIVLAGFAYYSPKSAGPAKCPYSNILDVSNMQFSMDGGANWTQLEAFNGKRAFQSRGSFLGNLLPGQSLSVLIRINVPSICNGTFVLNDNSKYVLLFS